MHFQSTVQGEELLQVSVQVLVVVDLEHAELQVIFDFFLVVLKLIEIWVVVDHGFINLNLDIG